MSEASKKELTVSTTMYNRCFDDDSGFAGLLSTFYISIILWTTAAVLVLSVSQYRYSKYQLRPIYYAVVHVVR